MFLVKNGNVKVEGLKAKIRSEYRAHDIPYYITSKKYSELKYRFAPVYLDLFYAALG